MAVIFIAVAIFRSKRLKKFPKGAQNLIETIVDFLFKNMNEVTGSTKKTLTFFPLVAGIFGFIILVNWFGLIPGVGSIGLHEIHEGKAIFVPLFRAGTADINTTLALAIVAVVATHIYGMKELGVGKHIGKFLVNPFKHSPILTGVGFLEMFGEISKIISFSFRLFGNIFAGEVLLIVVTGLVGYVAPVPFYFLELFVGFVQALVFAMLTLVFLTMSTAEQH